LQRQFARFADVLAKGIQIRGGEALHARSAR
jgi:hypothetical protein